MGEHYDHVTLEDRCAIARLHEGGQSLRQIAAALDRSPSTVSRELKRNRGAQVAGWLGRQKAATTISHESIYRFIYAQIRRTQDGAWRRYLPRAKFKRGWRGRRGGSPASFIQDRVAIAQRPAAARHRRSPGHWEADLMLFATYGQAILVAQQSSSADRRTTPRLAPAPRRQAPPNHHVRQRNRVRSALQTHPPARHPDLLLRYPQPLAKGRRRKRHRPLATTLAAQDRPRDPRPRHPQRLRRRLQQHTPQVPRIQITRSGLLCSTVALQM